MGVENWTYDELQTELQKRKDVLQAYPAEALIEELRRRNLVTDDTRIYSGDMLKYEVWPKSLICLNGTYRGPLRMLILKEQG